MKALLSDKDIDVNIKANDGCTPLHLAGLNNHIACVEELLAHKNIKVNIKNNKGQTALKVTTNKETIELLKQHGATD